MNQAPPDNRDDDAAYLARGLTVIVAYFRFVLVGLAVGSLLSGGMFLLYRHTFTPESFTFFKVLISTVGYTILFSCFIGLVLTLISFMRVRRPHFAWLFKVFVFISCLYLSAHFSATAFPTDDRNFLPQVGIGLGLGLFTLGILYFTETEIEECLEERPGKWSLAIIGAIEGWCPMVGAITWYMSVAFFFPNIKDLPPQISSNQMLGIMFVGCSASFVVGEAVFRLG